MKPRHTRTLLLVIGLILGLTFSLQAQEGRGRGRVRGTVQDTAGNFLEGVKIVAEHLQYGTTFESTSDDKGNWAVAGLGTGYFRFTATLEGYTPVYHEMRVSQFARNNPPIVFTLKKIEVAPISDMPAIEDDAAIVLFEEGNMLFEQKKFAEAAVKFEEFLTKNPTVFQVNINIGNCYKEMGEYEKAIQAFNAVLEKVKEEKGSIEGDEGAARALASLGETYMKKGDLDKASEYLTQAIEMFPDDETLAFNIGEIYFQQQQTDKAIEYYAKAAQINGKWAPPHRQMGYAFLNKGDYRSAIDSFKKFLEVAPDDALAPTIANLIPKLEELIKK